MGGRSYIMIKADRKKFWENVFPVLSERTTIVEISNSFSARHYTRRDHDTSATAEREHWFRQKLFSGPVHSNLAIATGTISRSKAKCSLLRKGISDDSMRLLPSQRILPQKPIRAIVRENFGGHYSETTTSSARLFFMILDRDPFITELLFLYLCSYNDQFLLS